MNNAFAVRLFGELSREGGNLFFSPLSIASALAMICAGAKGETARELEQVLSAFASGEQLHQELGKSLERLGSRATGGLDLRIANRLWLARDFTPEQSFVQLTTRYYGAPPELLDFSKDETEARKRINAWVKDRTRQLIPELLGAGDIDIHTALVVTNAVAFKGRWASSFDKRMTRREAFTPEAGPPQLLPLMHGFGMTAGYTETSDAQVLQLPYRSGPRGPHLALDVILPKTTATLVDVERALVKEGLGRYLKRLVEVEANVTLPRFDVARSSSLEQPLRALGMRRAFSSETDFSGLASLFFARENAAIRGGAAHSAFERQASPSRCPPGKALTSAWVGT